MSETEILKSTLDSLNSELEASKQMYNDCVNQLFRSKTACIYLQKEVQKLNQELNKPTISPEVSSATDKVPE